MLPIVQACKLRHGSTRAVPKKCVYITRCLPRPFVAYKVLTQTLAVLDSATPIEVLTLCRQSAFHCISALYSMYSDSVYEMRYGNGLVIGHFMQCTGGGAEGSG